MRNIKLTISYDGSEFHGWQRQPGVRTVQECIEIAISKMTGEDVSLLASGRTDAGVHAIGQVANFKTKSIIPLDGFLKGLNSILPDDISILDVQEMNLTFHARKHAREKEYMYRLIVSPVRLPLISKRAWVSRLNIDIKAMRDASKYLLGVHDFSSFMASGTSVKSTIRHLTKIDIKEMDCPEYDGIKEIREIRFFFRANGFLKYMVRNMVGLLWQVGSGKMPHSNVKDIIDKKDRNHGAPTAPAQGLYLKEVFY